MSDYLQPQWTVGCQTLCPCNSPGKNTGVGCHFFLQGIFPTQGLNPDLLNCRRILHCLSHIPNKGTNFTGLSDKLEKGIKKGKNRSVFLYEPRIFLNILLYYLNNIIYYVPKFFRCGIVIHLKFSISKYLLTLKYCN